MKNVLKSILCIVLLASMLISCNNGNSNVTETTTTTTTTTKPGPSYNTTPQTPAAKNLSWAEDQAFPTFKAPTGKLDAIPTDILSDDERVTVTCLMGLVNAVETRMVVNDGGVNNWLSTYKLKYEAADARSKYDVFKKYAPEISGVVLYSKKLNKEYMNLACTVANIKSAIPMTETVYKTWLKKGIELPVVEDLTTLEYKKTVDIYTYLYTTYWKDCDKRIVLVQRTDLYQMRDIAAATGAACIYLSCKGNEETKLFKKFLNDMTPGKSMLMGWYADQERELMVTAAQCGLSCVPADFFSCPTVFSQDIPIEINDVPDAPELENKIYVAFYFSDGDNIQYNMNAMRDYWRNNYSQRGKIAVNWTISPALVDVAPGMMNYYYTSASDSDCFVCGPSGMGYTMPINSWGPNAGAASFRNSEDFEAYINLTNNYVMQSGLRVVTIWDNLNTTHRKIYSTNGSYLYGITVQHFTDASLGAGLTGVVNDMLFQQMTPGYFASNAEGTTPLTDLRYAIQDAVTYQKYDGKKPVFVATQVSVWAFNKVADVIKLEQVLSKHYAEIYGEDVVEFVRADHYYNLYYEANGLPFDLTLKSTLTASATSNSDAAALTVDGTFTGESIWAATETGAQTVTYSLGKTYGLSEVALFHAGSNGLDATLNSKAFKIEVSTDGSTWTEVAAVADNTADWSSITFEQINASYLRVTITDPGSDNTARIADINIYGRVVG